MYQCVPGYAGLVSVLVSVPERRLWGYSEVSTVEIFHTLALVIVLGMVLAMEFAVGIVSP